MCSGHGPTLVLWFLSYSPVLLFISSDKERDGETTSELERRKKLKGIWITGRQGLSEREAAEFIIREARSIVQVLGLLIFNFMKTRMQGINSVDSCQGGARFSGC